VEQAAMESTGVYWKPVWNALEKHFRLILANPYQVKSIPKREDRPEGCRVDCGSVGTWADAASGEVGAGP
jgi:hypothetical protein